MDRAANPGKGTRIFPGEAHHHRSFFPHEECRSTRGFQNKPVPDDNPRNLQVSIRATDRSRLPRATDEPADRSLRFEEDKAHEQPVRTAPSSDPCHEKPFRRPSNDELADSPRRARKPRNTFAHTQKSPQEPPTGKSGPPVGTPVAATPRPSPFVPAESSRRGPPKIAARISFRDSITGDDEINSFCLSWMRSSD